MNIDELYLRARAGDSASEGELFRLLTARLLYFARQKTVNVHDCEEIVQNTLMAVASKYKDIEIEVSFSSWVYKIFENKFIDYLRASKTRKDRFSQLPESDNFHADQDIDISFKNRLIECLRKIKTANNRFARILVLRYLGYEFDELCDRLKITKTNCYSILSRSRDLLEKCLRQGDLDK
ncbi:MAG: RNA polymerase sigma factor [Candidatus Zixiibacteriota bacterium]